MILDWVNRSIYSLINKVNKVKPKHKDKEKEGKSRG